MISEPTKTEEIQYIVKEVSREFKENLPQDLGFLVLIYHQNDGAVGWTAREGNEAMVKARSVVRDWLDRADRMVTHA